MEEKWCRYNTLLDAITELPIPSEKATQWLRTECAYETEALSSDELEVLEKLPLFHREFLQNKNIPPYAIKTSLARLAQKEKEAMDLWNTAALRGLLDTPSALSIIKLSLLVYPLIDLAIMRRQLCQSVIFEIKHGNLKPYFYPKSLEGKGFSDREKLQAFIELPLTEQVKATIEINELGSGLGSVHSFQYKAYALWKRYHDHARITDEPTPKPPAALPGIHTAKTAPSDRKAKQIAERVAAYNAVCEDSNYSHLGEEKRRDIAGGKVNPKVSGVTIWRALEKNKG